MTKFSIITPVYNAEKYIDECITSVLKQNYSDFEMLLINDGSTDLSLEILEKYSKNDERIKVFNKENEGQGVARNFALEYAQGDYVLYLDSDDLLVEGALEKLSKKIEEDDYDIIFFNAYKYFENTQKTDKFYFNQAYYKKFKENVFSPSDAEEILFNTSGLLFKAFKKSFMTEYDIKFSPTRFAEDNELYIKSILYARKMVCLYDFIVSYRIRNNSSTSKRHLNIDAQKYVFYACEKIFLEYCKNNANSILLREFLKNRYNQLYYHFTNTDKKYRPQYYKMLRSIVKHIDKEYYSKFPEVTNEISSFETILNSKNYFIFELKTFIKFLKIHLGAYLGL